MTDNLFPWLTVAWKRLAERRDALPHALLLRGRSGLGKSTLARRFAQGLLCDQPTASGEPCGACPACGWFAQGNHPDFRQVEPEVLSAAPRPEDAPPAKSETLSKQIKIDQIRELQTFLSVGSHRGGLRIVLVRPAEAMNPATANALLKSLEEPGPRTLFLLVSSRPERLLPTIRSRCQAVEVAAAGHETALDWLRTQGVRDAAAALAFAGLAPLDVLEQSGMSDARERLVAELCRTPFEPLSAADRCAVIEAPALVDALQKWVCDLGRATAGLGARYYPGQESALRQISTSVDKPALLRFGRDLAHARGIAQHPLNPRLFMEDLFIRYAATRENAHA
jgi:DNA polymerase-3 subunit delta'